MSENKSEIIPPGFIYTLSEPESFGRMPIRTELTVLPADDPNNLKLGFGIQCYSGIEIHPVINGDVQKESIKDENGLYDGMNVEAWGVVWTVRFDKDGSPYLDSLKTSGFLEFNIDDRECWVCGGLINKRCYMKPKKISIVK